jgi:hypothetical protein
MKKTYYYLTIQLNINKITIINNLSLKLKKLRVYSQTMLRRFGVRIPAGAQQKL